jgi:hypothetical protein
VPLQAGRTCASTCQPFCTRHQHQHHDGPKQSPGRCRRRHHRTPEFSSKARTAQKHLHQSNQSIDLAQRGRGLKTFCPLSRKQALEAGLLHDDGPACRVIDSGVEPALDAAGYEVRISIPARRPSGLIKQRTSSRISRKTNLVHPSRQRQFRFIAPLRKKGMSARRCDLVFSNPHFW